MEYKYKWYIPDAYLHSRGTGYFTSHEGCAFINETGRDAHVRFTFYFQDREPMTGYTSVVPARRISPFGAVMAVDHIAQQFLLWG